MMPVVKKKVLALERILCFNACMKENDTQIVVDGRVRSGQVRMGKLSREERRDLAKKGAKARWERAKNQQLIESSSIGSPREEGELPVARYRGALSLNGVD